MSERIRENIPSLFLLLLLVIAIVAAVWQFNRVSQLEVALSQASEASLPTGETPEATPTTVPSTPTPVPAAPANTGADDVVAERLSLYFGFTGDNPRKEFWDFFEISSNLQGPGDLATCPGEEACVRLLGEKNAEGAVVGVFSINNKTTATFDGWECAGSPTGQPKVEPGYHECVEGVTIRPWQTTETAAIPATTETPAPPEAYWPQTSQEFLDWVTEGAPDQLPEGLLPLKLADISRPEGESNSWQVEPRRQDGNIIPFWVHNYSGCKQDGWIGSEQTVPGIPASYSGRAEGVTFRPCEGQ